MDLDEVINHAVDATLGPAGFHSVEARKWVRSSKIPVRELFVVNPLKGGVYSAAWGFALDFVPLSSGGKLKWKKSDRSCRADLWIDPIDLAGEVPGWCSFVHLPGYKVANVRTIETTIQHAVAQARLDFDHVTTLAELERLFDERSRLTYRRFGFNNYVQVYLAWGLLCCALGREADGERYLLKFCQQEGCARTHPFIEKAISKARAAAGHPGSEAC